MIMDVKESGVRGATRRMYPILLPRIIDVVDGNLELPSLCLLADHVDLERGVGVEKLVLDFQGAFWQVPLRPGGTPLLRGTRSEPVLRVPEMRPRG